MRCKLRDFGNQGSEELSPVCWLNVRLPESRKAEAPGTVLKDEQHLGSGLIQEHSPGSTVRLLNLDSRAIGRTRKKRGRKKK